MVIAIGYKSAYQYWDKANPRQRGLAFASTRSIPIKPYSEVEIRDACSALLLDVPVDVIVSSPNHRHASNKARAHLASKRFNKGDFYSCGTDILVAAPELCYFQLARGLSIPKAALLALEMCGGFSTQHILGRVIEREPLTSIDRLRKCAKRRYAKNSESSAYRALRWVVDGSMSPMESALFLALCLPPRYGGFSIPFPELNVRIELSEQLMRMAHKHHLKGDLVWRKERLVVEYNSDQEHTGGLRIAQDARRINALKHAGYNTIVVTKRQLQEAEDIALLAQQLARILGKRLAPSETRQYALRHKLYAEIFPWWTYVGI
ncbi:MAG: hypothetical protein IJ113_03675 [Eggerthellaceae bacterium]|nr:hypothetical protein [Eggerthellaceae bacterium]